MACRGLKLESGLEMSLMSLQWTTSRAMRVAVVSQNAPGQLLARGHIFTTGRGWLAKVQNRVARISRLDTNTFGHSSAIRSVMEKDMTGQRPTERIFGHGC